MRNICSLTSFSLAIALLISGCASETAATKSVSSPNGHKLNREAEATLETLYAEAPSARSLVEKSKGVLIFSDVVKAGFIGGADFGKGVLKKGRKVDGYYNLVTASVGFQAGVQTYDYVLVFMNKSALDALDALDGFQVGIGPSIVIADQGVAGSISTSSARADVYAFIFDQKGIMGAVNLEGSKITRIDP